MVRKAEVIEQLRDRLPFLDYAPMCFISAVHRGAPRALRDDEGGGGGAAAGRRGRVCTRCARRSSAGPRPRRAALRDPVRLQVAVSPPTFALRVNLPDDVHFSYERYLVNSLRHAYGFVGTPLRVSLRKGQGRKHSRPVPRRAQR